MIPSLSSEINIPKKVRGTIHDPNGVSLTVSGICTDSTDCTKVCQQIQVEAEASCFEFKKGDTQQHEKDMDLFNYINGVSLKDLGKNAILVDSGNFVHEGRGSSLLDDEVFREIQPYIKEEKKRDDPVTPSSFISKGDEVVLPGRYYRGWFTSNNVEHRYAIKLKEKRNRFKEIYVDNIQFKGKYLKD